MNKITNDEFKNNCSPFVEMGKKNELIYKDEIINYFNNLLGVNLNLDYDVKKSRYSIIDWTFTHKKTGVIISIELKSRSVSKEEYPETIYGTNKFIKQVKQLYLNPDNKAYAVFLYTNELCYYEIKKDSIAELTFKDCLNTLRGKYEKSNYAHIPINKLISISTIL
jgi:hypothetical protein